MVQKIIHVNGPTIRTNKKNGSNLPALRVKTRRNGVPVNEFAHKVIIHTDPPIILEQRLDKPLSCGATLYIRTHADVTAERSDSYGATKTTDPDDRAAE